MVAAAILGGGALSAGASIFGSTRAANAQTNAANMASANSRYFFDQSKNLLSPFINAGTGAISQLQDFISPTGGSTGNNLLSSIIKLVSPGANMTDTLRQLPGYQFQEDQGTRAVMNRLAGRGLGGSPGAIAKGVSSFVTGLADSSWGDLVSKALSTFGAGTNALQGLVNTGGNAASSLSGTATSTAGSINNAITGAGNAQAANWNNIGSAVGGLGNSLLTASLLGGGFGGGNNSIYGGSPYGPMSVGGAPLSGYSGVTPGY